MAEQTPRNSAPLKHPARQLNRLIENVPFELYTRAEGINASGLAQVLRSPMHYRHWISAPAKPPTKAMELGKLTHLCILEPDLYDKQVLVAPEGLRPKELKDLREGSAPDVQVVTEEQHHKVLAMRDAVYRNAEAAPLLSRGQREACLWWDDPDYQVRCKARVDFVSHQGGQRTLLDLKTTSDVGAVNFSKSVVNYRYDMQAVHYLEGGRVSGAYDHENFFFLVVESEPPHACVLYTISNSLRGVGVQWREEAMSRYAQAVRANKWEGPPAVDELGIVKWAKVPGEEDELLA